MTPLKPTKKLRPPEPWESGRKDTVISYPGEVTRIVSTFEVAGQYVWHCHIVEHEDNEMMRPYRIGPEQPGQPLRPPAHDGRGMSGNQLGGCARQPERSLHSGRPQGLKGSSPFPSA